MVIVATTTEIMLFLRVRVTTGLSSRVWCDDGDYVDDAGDAFADNDDDYDDDDGRCYYHDYCGHYGCSGHYGHRGN